jgi:hypothetical protein
MVVTDCVGQVVRVETLEKREVGQGLAGLEGRGGWW